MSISCILPQILLFQLSLTLSTRPEHINRIVENNVFPSEGNYLKLQVFSTTLKFESTAMLISIFYNVNMSVKAVVEFQNLMASGKASYETQIQFHTVVYLIVRNSTDSLLSSMSLSCFTIPSRISHQTQLSCLLRDLQTVTLFS